MRKLIYISFLLVFIKISAQNKIFNVDYLVTRKLFEETTYNYQAKLTFDNKKAVFITDIGTEKIIKDSLHDDFSVYLPTDIDPTFKNCVISNTTNNIIQFTEEVGDKNYVITDSIPAFDWKIENKTKTIAGITCTKATCNFRGRNYIAWFTYSIPIATGPWKFRGLPGLILEVYDLDLKYIWQATKIKTTGNFESIDFKNYATADIKELIKLHKKTDDEYDRKMSAKVPKGGSVKTSRPRLMELKYEWEN